MGPNLKALKTGRHSKFLPANLDQIYKEARNNPDLMEMADHIALLEARMQEVLEQAASGDPVPQWADIREAFGSLASEVLGGGKQETIFAAIERFNALIESGIKWDSTWHKVIDTMEQLRKMTDTEVKRKKELNQMVPVERVVVLMAAVGTAVKRNVKDPDEVAAVYRELAMLHGDNRVPATGAPLVQSGMHGIIDVSPDARPVTRRKLKDVMTRKRARELGLDGTT